MNSVSTGVAVTTATVSTAPLIGYFVEVFEAPAMTEPQLAAAAAVLGVFYFGLVSLVGPIARALADRVLIAIQPAVKEVTNA